MNIKNSLLAAVLSVLVACSPSKKQENTTEETIPVRIVQIHKEAFSPSITTSGVVASDKEARLSFKIGGIIKQLYVKEGDVVRPGQLLASLDLAEINAQQKQADAAYEKAKRDFDRVSRLYNDSAATLELYQNAKTGLDVAQETLNQVRFNSKYAAITSNISGKVVKKLANEGEITAPGAPIYIIQASGADSWVLKAGVSDKDWARLSLGDEATISFDAYPAEKISANVSLLPDAADPYTGTFPIELSLSTQSALILGSGLVGEAHIRPRRTKEVWIIPIEALQEANKDQGVVYALSNDRKSVRRIAVTIAGVYGKTVAIASGLDSVEHLITDGSAYLTPSSKINIISTQE
jgi:RND family efflux transporter MFP subunit